MVNKNTKIVAKLLAEIVNDFFEPLSYKTIALISLFFVVLLFVGNCIFGRRGLGRWARRPREVEYIKRESE